VITQADWYEVGLNSGEFEGFVGYGVGGAAGGEHGEGRPEAGVGGGSVAGAHYRDVSGAGVYDEEEEAVAGESERGGAVAYVDGVDAAAVFWGVDGDPLGAEVGDVEHGVVSGHEAVDGVVAHGVGAAHVVFAGDDFRDGVGARIGDEEFAAVGLEGELDGALTYIHEGFEAVWFGCVGLVGLGWVGLVSESDCHDLMAGGAGDECLGRVGEDDGVTGAGAAVDGGANGTGGWAANAVNGGREGGYVGEIDDGGAVAAVVGDDEGFAVGRDAEGDWLFSRLDLRDFAAGFQLKDGDGVGA